jgi:phage shock protein E
MSKQSIKIIATLSFVFMFGLLGKLFGQSSANLDSLIAQGAFLVDVRTPAEFASGHVKGSVNIPLDSVAKQINKFKGKENIIVFCRSGARSGQAKSILESKGFTNVVNGGSWTTVNQYVKD